MLLLLVRHALAADRDPELYPDDTERPLVNEGRRIQRRMSRRLRKKRLVPTLILSSPWRRAWQTAGILAEETLGHRTRRLPCTALADEPHLEDIGAAIGPVDQSAIVALVGHEPWMTELAGLLLLGSATGLTVHYPKSAIMGVETGTVEPGAGTLRFFWPPDWGGALTR